METLVTKTLIICGLLTLSLSCFGQNNDNNSNVKNIKSIKQSKSESIPTEKKSINENGTQTMSIGKRKHPLTTQDKIEALQSHIEAIDIKVEYVGSDKKLKQKAIKDNWFETMQTIREELITELNELKK